MPTASVVDVYEALPLARLAVPRFVEPSRKVTLPAGMPEAEVTVAESVTALPAVMGLGVTLRTVLVLAGLGVIGVVGFGFAGAVLFEPPPQPAKMQRQSKERRDSAVRISASKLILLRSKTRGGLI